MCQTNRTDATKSGWQQPKHINKEKIQNKFLRIIPNKPYDTPIRELYHTAYKSSENTQWNHPTLNTKTF